MAESDPTLKESLFAARSWARETVEPYLTWLPDGLEPYAVDAAAILALLAALVGIWKSGADLWRGAMWAPTSLWRSVTGSEPPPSESKMAAEAATRAAEAAQRTERSVEDALRALAERAEQSGAHMPEDAIERAVAAAREVLESNDPSKAAAQAALREGNIRAAEDALADAFGREAKAASLLDDEASQLKAKAARTAREKAALAATRSVAEALRWYQIAADLKPEDFWTHIELARLQQAVGSLGVAMSAARAAQNAARDDREHSVALNEIGDVLRSQGDLGTALESYRASHAIFERLAEADDSNAGLQRDLSVSHERIGDVLRSQGDLGTALESYRASHAIFERLAEADDSNAGLQRDLSVSTSRFRTKESEISRKSGTTLSRLLMPTN